MRTKKENPIKELHLRKLFTKAFTWDRNDDHPSLQVQMTLEIKDDGKIVFSFVGTISLREYWQCEDSLNEYLKGDKLRDEIYRLWEEYHLNDCHAGTPKQERLLKMGRLAWVDLSDYTKQCEFLDEYNMLYDDNDGEQYKYWSARLYRQIPEQDLWIIFNLLTME